MPIRDIQSFNFIKDHRLLLDTNVWLFSFGPFPKPHRAGIYDLAMRDIRIKKSLVHLNAFVLSEFMNAYARIVYKSWIKENYSDVPDDKKPSFKKFRDHSDFKPVAEEIRIAVMGILQMATECSNSDFDRGKANKFLSEYGKICADFNDQIIADICDTKKYLLVTDDADFKNFGDITILTGNSAYFR